MGVKKSPQTFQTSDGFEYDTEEEAERHEAVATAKQNYEGARDAFCRVLAESQKTADGVPFEFGVFRDYWFILEWDGFPRLHKVCFLCMRNDNFELNEGSEISLVQEENGRRRTFKISDLYWNHKAAGRALLKVQAERLKEFGESMEKLQAEVSE
jgi:hypothetical protein